MMTSESQLYRRTLIGIRITPFTVPKLFKIAGWNVFDAGHVDTLPPEERQRNLNYQIQRGDTEKILVRLYLDDSKTKIRKLKFHYVSRYTDYELAYFVTMALTKKLRNKIQLTEDTDISRHEF
jgi:hypothetical protein